MIAPEREWRPDFQFRVLMVGASRISLFSDIVHWYLAVFQMMMENIFKKQIKTNPSNQLVNWCQLKMKETLFLSPRFICVVIPPNPSGVGTLLHGTVREAYFPLASWLP